MKGATEMSDHEMGWLEKLRASRSLVGRCYSFGFKGHLLQELFEGPQEDDNLIAKLKSAFVFMLAPWRETAANCSGSTRF